MKTLITIILLALVNNITKCQTFTAAFDPWDNTALYSNQPIGSGWSYWNNVSVYTLDQEPLLLQSYLDMFKATKDIHYLEKFAIQATRVMENRFLSPKRPNSHCHAELVSASQNKILTL